MPLKKMRIRIAEGGRTEIAVENGAGDDCLAFTNAIEQTLGNVERRTLTADYDREPEQEHVSESERPTL